MKEKLTVGKVRKTDRFRKWEEKGKRFRIYTGELGVNDMLEFWPMIQGTMMNAISRVTFLA